MIQAKKQAQLQQLQGMQARTPRQEQRLQYLSRQQQKTQPVQSTTQQGSASGLRPAARPGSSPAWNGGAVPRPGTGQQLPQMPQFPANGMHGGMQIDPNAMPGLQGQNMGGLLDAAMNGIKGNALSPAPMPGRSPGFGMTQGQGQGGGTNGPMGQAQVTPGGMNMGMRPRGIVNGQMTGPFMGPGGIREEY